MSELVKVYSPTGEVFENSPFNARDLVNLAGWSYNAPASVEVVPEVKIAEAVSEPVVEVKAVEIEETSEVKEAEEVVAPKEEAEEVKAPISRGRPSKK